MFTGEKRKRWNRNLSRKVFKGLISEEEAQTKFIRPESSYSKKEAKDGIVAEEEAKSKRSSRTVKRQCKGEKTKKAIPRALKANTEEDVQEMFDSGYYRFPERPFWDGLHFKNVDWGTHALWKNVPTGKNGGESTKVEYFHGEVHGWETDEIVIVS